MLISFGILPHISACESGYIPPWRSLIATQNLELSSKLTRHFCSFLFIFSVKDKEQQKKNTWARFEKEISSYKWSYITFSKNIHDVCSKHCFLNLPTFFFNKKKFDPPLSNSWQNNEDSAYQCEQSKAGHPAIAPRPPDWPQTLSVVKTSWT